MIRYRIVSNSMEPILPVGCEVILEKVEFLDLKKFDIIVFKEGSTYTCHYVWHINKHLQKGLITTRNLDGYCFDDPFEFSEVVGRVNNFKLPFWLKFKLNFWVR